jgi:hypothetical protein
MSADSKQREAVNGHLHKLCVSCKQVMRATSGRYRVTTRCSVGQVRRTVAQNNREQLQ